MKILVVDDEIMIREVIKEYCLEEGFSVDDASNGYDAFNMLKQLTGKTHTVYTGVCIIQGNNEIIEAVSCDVTFKKMTDSEIENYIASGEPMDKAGAYGIQGKGSAYVEKISGDYFAVVGFPCCYVNSVLNKLGIFPSK